MNKLAAVSAIALIIQLFAPALIQTARAGNLTYTLVRTDRMAQSTATTGTICAKPATVGTEGKVVVTFPTGYTVGAFGTWTVSTATTTGWPKDPVNDATAATAWPGITAPASGADVTGQAVTFASADLTAATWYCFNWTSTTALTTKSSATANNTGTVVTQTAAAATIDTGNYAIATVTNDQIAVSATVTASFNFALSSNAAALGTLSSSNPIASSAINATVNTNAVKGWNIWAADPAGTPGLTSTTASKTIGYNASVGAVSAVLSNGVEGFNLGADSTGLTQTSGSGTVTVDPNFNSSGTAFKGGGLDGTPRIVAVSTGTANTSVVPLKVNASISSITPAASDYAATITVIAAGRF